MARLFAVVCLIAVVFAQVATAETLAERVRSYVSDSNRKGGMLQSVILDPFANIFTSVPRRVRTESGLKTRIIVDEQGQLLAPRSKLHDSDMAKTLGQVIQRLRDSDSLKEGGIGASMVFAVSPESVVDKQGITHSVYSVNQLDQGIADKDERSALHKTIDRVRDTNGKGGASLLRVDETTTHRRGQAFKRFIVDPVSEGEVEMPATSQRRHSLLGGLMKRLRDSDSDPKEGGIGAFAVSPVSGGSSIVVEDLMALRRNIVGMLSKRVSDRDQVKEGGIGTSYIRVIPMNTEPSVPENNEFLVEEL